MTGRSEVGTEVDPQWCGVGRKGPRRTRRTRCPMCCFDCGNSELHNIFQHFPRVVDKALQKSGGARVVDRGEGDASGDFDESLEAWMNSLWPALAEACGLAEDELALHDNTSDTESI